MQLYSSFMILSVGSITGVAKADADPHKDPPRAQEADDEVQQVVGAPFLPDHDC